MLASQSAVAESGTGSGAIQEGRGANASGMSSIAYGREAKAVAGSAVAIGTGAVAGATKQAVAAGTITGGNGSGFNATAIGFGANASNQSSTAIGANAKASGFYSAALGNMAHAEGGLSVALGWGSIATKETVSTENASIDGIRSRNFAGSKSVANVAVGSHIWGERVITSVAAGRVTEDSTDAVNGSQLLQVTRSALDQVPMSYTDSNGTKVYKQLDGSFTLKDGTPVAESEVMVTMNLSANTPTRLANVAAGVKGTDAVNVNQLNGLRNDLHGEIRDVGKHAYAGVAGAIAQGSIPQVTTPGAKGIGVGTGYYSGQSALAVGVSAMSDSGQWVFKGNLSANSRGRVGAGAGALYQW